MSNRETKNSNFSERILRLRFDLGNITQKELGEKLGISDNYVYMLEKGTRIPGPSLLDRIALLEATVPKTANSNGQNDGKNEPKGAWCGPYYGTSDEVPIISWASAGLGRESADMGHDVPKLKTNCRDPNAYGIEIFGDSMEPVFVNGDIAVCTPNLRAQAGDYVVIKTTDEVAYFKKYLGQYGNCLKLYSINELYPIIELPVEHVAVIHPVWGVLKLFKERIK
jgi:phage repressor protein C with HTH and peptisase S24 domain